MGYNGKPIAQASACALIIPSELLHKNKLLYSINPFSPAIPRLYEGSGHKRTLAPLRVFYNKKLEAKLVKYSRIPEKNEVEIMNPVKKNKIKFITKNNKTLFFNNQCDKEDFYYRHANSMLFIDKFCIFEID